MTDTSQRPATRRGVLLFLLAGVIAMLSAWFYGRVTHPDLVKPVPQQQQMPLSQGGAGMDPKIAELMEQVAQNPMDGQALYHLAQHLANAERFEPAESFIDRAVAVEPNNVDWLYLMGVIKHSRGKHEEAAKVLERVLVLRDTPDVHYSLGVLYLYYLKQPDKGRAQLETLLKAKDCPPELQKMAQDALAESKK